MWLVYIQDNEIGDKPKKILGVFSNFKRAYERFEGKELHHTLRGHLDTYNKACKARVKDNTRLFAMCQYYKSSPALFVVIARIELNEEIFY